MKEQTMAVQRMQEYIEVHLTEEITLNHLAEASLYSPCSCTSEAFLSLYL